MSEEREEPAAQPGTETSVATETVPIESVATETVVSETPAEVPALETLLSGAADKPVETTEKPAIEAATAEVPALPPAYEWQPFALPEDLAGITLAEEGVASLREALTAEGLSPQDRGQRLLDLHIAEMRAYDERALERQIATFQSTQLGWIEKFKGDPEIGGAAARTHQRLADAAIMRLHSTEKRFGQPLLAAQNGAAQESDHSAFMDMLKVTGAINHPEMVRHLARVENILREPARPAPALGASAVPRDIGNRRPSDQAGNPGRRATRMRDMYDHDRSQQTFNGSGGR